MSGDGTLENLSEEQARILKEFREAVKDVLKNEHDDAYLLRWLRARKFNLKAAECMLRKNLEWREAMGADSIFEYQVSEVVKKYIPGGIVAHDKEGSPVYALRHGNVDLCGLVRCAGTMEVIKGFVYHYEMVERDLREQSKKLGRRIETCIVIHDFEGWSISQYIWKQAFEVLVEGLKMLEANYPERLKRVYMIKTSKFFNFGWAIIRPFLSEDTLEKLLFFTNDRDWKEGLLRDVGAEDLPVFWGGEKVDPDGDPEVPSLCSKGGIIPKSMYPDSSKISASTHPDWTNEVVDRRGSLCVPVTIQETGSVIEWEFATDSYDIGFGVFRRQEKDNKEHRRTWLDFFTSSKSDETSVLPVRVVNCHLVPETGTLFCDTPGTYVLKFDNSYSWYHKKKVMFNVRVVPPAVTQEIATALDPDDHTAHKIIAST